MVSTPTRSRGEASGDVGAEASPAARKKPARLRGHVRSFWEGPEGKSKAPNSSTYYLILGCATASPQSV